MTKEEMIAEIAPFEAGYVPCEETQADIGQADIVTITGMRGVGKDTSRKATPFWLSRSMASRDIRLEDGEIDGVDYDFLKRADYPAIVVAVRQKKLVQFAIYQDEFYGTMPTAYSHEKPSIIDVVYDQVEPVRVLPFRSCVSTYLTSRDYDTWRHRWAGRGYMEPKKVEASLVEAKDSLEWGLGHDYVRVIMNDTIDQCVTDIRHVVEDPERYTPAQELLARNAAAGILRQLKIELGDPVSV